MTTELNRFGRLSKNMFFARHVAQPKYLKFITGWIVFSKRKRTRRLCPRVLIQFRNCRRTSLSCSRQCAAFACVSNRWSSGIIAIRSAFYYWISTEFI